MLGYHPQVILAGRRINDGMGAHVAGQAVKALVRRGAEMREAVVTVLGFTFKENVSDLRNTRVIDVVRELEGYGLDVQVHDPRADPEEARREYGVEITAAEALRPADAVILAVAHDEFIAGSWAGVTTLLRGARGSVIDVKGVLDRTACPGGVDLRRL